jgi:hypothetical protein
MFLWRQLTESYFLGESRARHFQPLRKEPFCCFLAHREHSGPPLKPTSYSQFWLSIRAPINCVPEKIPALKRLIRKVSLYLLNLRTVSKEHCQSHRQPSRPWTTIKTFRMKHCVCRTLIYVRDRLCLESLLLGKNRIFIPLDTGEDEQSITNESGEEKCLENCLECFSA